MKGPAGTLLMIATELSEDLEAGLTMDRDSMPWDEYRALKALRFEAAAFRKEQEPTQ